MEITVYRDITGFAALEGEWNSLLRRSRSETIFLTHEWQSTWWQWLGAERGPLYLLACRDGGRLAGILPLYLSGPAGSRVLGVVGCVEVSDYLDLIVEEGHEEAVYTAFLDWLSGPAAPGFDCVELCNQPASSPARLLLPDLARRRGWAAEVAQADVCPIVTLPRHDPQGNTPVDAETLWNSYLDTLDKKQRHEIRRKMRRVEREAPDSRVRFVTGGDDIAAEMERFITLHRQSTSDKDAFMTPEMQRFFQAIAETAAQAGWLQLAFLEIGGEAVASTFCFDYGGDILLYNSGYDPAAYPQLSTGWVLLAHIIRHAIGQGRRQFDFLQGSEDYKYRFGGVDTPVYHTLLRQP